MQRLLFILLAVLFVKIGISQQMPIFTNTLFSQQYNNPATMIINSNKRFSLNSSLSATGYSDAPKSYTVSYVHPFALDNKNLHMPSFDFGRQLIPKRYNHAFGAYMMYDSYGSINQLSAMLSYSQSFTFDKYTYIAFGLSTGIYSYGVDYSKLTIKEKNDNTFAQFQNAASNLIYWDANFGFLAKHKNYKFEFAMKQFLADKAKLSNEDIDAEIKQSYYISTQAVYKIATDVHIAPRVEYYKTKSLPYNLNVKLPFIYRDRWLASLNYQHNRSVGFGIGFIYNFIIINYSFQYNTSMYSYIGNTNNELGVILLINRRKSITFNDIF